MISFTNLTVQEADVVINGLRKLPIEIAGDLHQKLLMTATQQYAAAQKKQEPEEPPKE